MNKSKINSMLKEAVDSGLPIKVRDTWETDFTSYQIESVEVVDGVCYINTYVCGLDEKLVDIDIDKDVEEKLFLETIDEAFAEYDFEAVDAPIDTRNLT